jgi:hypothetical protein
MMLQHGLGDRPWKINSFQDVIAGSGMLFDDIELRICNPAWFTENLRRYDYLPDIMNGSHDTDSLYHLHLCSYIYSGTVLPMFVQW